MDISDTSDEPVTVLARHTVRPGSESAFERWMEGIAAASKGYEGYMGTEVIRPMQSGQDSAEEPGNEYVSIFRFDTYAHLEAWIHSSERESWLARTGEFSDEAPRVDYHSLEFWFSPEQHEGRAPSKVKMAGVTFCVIWPLVHFVPPLVGHALGPRSLLAEGASVAVIVLLMTYAVMPSVTRLLARWLYA